MYLIIRGLGHDIGGFTEFKPVLLGNLWSGICDVPEAQGKKLVKYPNVDELNDAQWESVKKTAYGEEIAYRSFTTHQQDSAQNPNAVHAEIEKQADRGDKPKDPKKLLTVEEVEVERPLEEPIVRARKKTGHYRGDDPSTPDVNEAWKGGKKPKPRKKK